MPTNTTLTPTTLKLIRIALLTGVLIFGAVVLYLLRTDAATTLSDDTGNVLRLAFFAFAVLELPLLFALRSAQSRATEFQKAGSYAIMGWALGEGVALFGGVAWLVTGRVVLYVIGLLVIVTAFAALPIPDEQQRT